MRSRQLAGLKFHWFTKAISEGQMYSSLEGSTSEAMSGEFDIWGVPYFRGMNLPILLLAAGASSRMGRSKQMLVVDGEPLLVRSVRAALETGSPVFVVLGAKAEEHKSLLTDFPVRLVHHPSWERGMGSSLKEGLKAILAEGPGVTGVVVMLCDQPRVNSEHLRTLMNRAGNSPKTIIASAYHQTIGVPALFKSALFPQLLALGDEAGAAKLIRSQPDRVEAVDFPEGVIDLDTPDDVARYEGSHGPK
ncbi:MAG: nucleotidyltransferase family protein [Cyclobacteriaceae bacterium]|nr:nucleotidyltransferase family protein [Cyclobacteriaceae bacterium]